jgi:hypothetical protein
MSELRDLRLDHLEEDVREIKTVLARLEPMIVAIYAQLPHLATKAELALMTKADLAKMPGKLWLAMVIGILIAAYAAGLAALAALPVVSRLLR